MHQYQFAEQNRGHRCKEWTCGPGKAGGGAGADESSSIDMYIVPCVK